MCEVVIITRQPLEKVVISRVESGGKMIIDGLDYPEARNILFFFWFPFLPS